jgi:hypothetical protein
MQMPRAGKFEGSLLPFVKQSPLRCMINVMILNQPSPLICPPLGSSLVADLSNLQRFWRPRPVVSGKKTVQKTVQALGSRANDYLRSVKDTSLDNSVVRIRATATRSFASDQLFQEGGVGN